MSQTASPTLERVVIERAELLNQRAVLRSALGYVLEHHLNGDECLCPAARSVAEIALEQTEAGS